MSSAFEQYTILHDSDKTGQDGRDQGDRCVHNPKPSQQDELAAAIAPHGTFTSGHLEVYEDASSKESLGNHRCATNRWCCPDPPAVELKPLHCHQDHAVACLTELPDNATDSRPETCEGQSVALHSTCTQAL
jgi:hypothetical protein